MALTLAATALAAAALTAVALIAAALAAAALALASAPCGSAAGRPAALLRCLRKTSCEHRSGRVKSTAVVCGGCGPGSVARHPCCQASLLLGIPRCQAFPIARHHRGLSLPVAWRPGARHPCSERRCCGLAFGGATGGPVRARTLVAQGGLPSPARQPGPPCAAYRGPPTCASPHNGKQGPRNAARDGTEEQQKTPSAAFLPAPRAPRAAPSPPAVPLCRPGALVHRPGQRYQSRSTPRRAERRAVLQTRGLSLALCALVQGPYRGTLARGATGAARPAVGGRTPSGTLASTSRAEVCHASRLRPGPAARASAGARRAAGSASLPSMKGNHNG